MTVPMIPLRRVARCVNGGTPTADVGNWNGDVPWATPIDLARVNGGLLTSTDRTLTKTGLRGGSAVVGGGALILSIRAPIGYVARVVVETAFNQGCRGLEPRPALDARYLQHWLWSQTDRLQALGTGSTFQELSTDALQTFPVPLQTLEAQRRIADFLDDQVSRIDRAVEGRQRQEVVLQEQIGAVAHSEVTGSTCSDRKPSGLAWSRDLPSHWGATRLGNVARLGTGHTPSRSEPDYWVDCDIPWVTTGEVKRFRYDQIDSIDDTGLHISELGLANSAAVIHPARTVALSRTASAGFSIVMEVAMTTSQDYATWTPGPLLDSFYLLWCLRAMRRDLMERLAMGSTHKTIYFPDLEGIRIPLPPMVEQHEIVERISSSVSAIRSAQGLVTESIRLMEERKRALITAAVTGEFDVTTASDRGVA